MLLLCLSWRTAIGPSRKFAGNCSALSQDANAARAAERQKIASEEIVFLYFLQSCRMGLEEEV